MLLEPTEQNLFSISMRIKNFTLLEFLSTCNKKIS